MLVGLFSGGVLVRCVANAGTSTSPGTSEPSALDFLLHLVAPFAPVLCGSAPLSGGNGSVIMSEENAGESADPQTEAQRRPGYVNKDVREEEDARHKMFKPALKKVAAGTEVI